MHIVITGVSKGLGLAMAEKFINMGNSVSGCSRDKDKIDTLKNKHPQENFHVCDVTDYDAVAEWAEEVIAKFGAPDYLINNAALMNNIDSLWNINSDDFSRLIDVNIKGTFNTIHAFVPHMIKRSKGTIVNFSSGWGRFTSPGVAPYCTSKFAIEGLSQSLAQELPEGMICTALNPGMIDTDMLKSCFPGDTSIYPAPELWAEQAVERIFRLNKKDNGQPTSI